MDNCHRCGIPYNDSFADWTICRNCAMEEGKQRGVIYMDSFGIMWTQEDLDEAGGLAEVIKLNKQAHE